MQMIPRVVLSALAVVAIGGGALYLLTAGGRVDGDAPTGQPSAAPSPTPSPAPVAAAAVPEGWTTYTSSRFGYSIAYPADWVATPATQDWHGVPYPDSPAIDKFGIGPTTTRLFVSSVLLEAGNTAAELIASVDGTNGGICELSDRHSITIDGVPARQEDFFCFKQDHGTEVVLANDRRFYTIDLFSSAPLTKAERATFDQALASIRFAD